MKYISFANSSLLANLSLMQAAIHLTVFGVRFDRLVEMDIIIFSLR